MPTSLMKRTERAFTLMELSVVIVILALFAAVIVPNLLARRTSRAAAAFFVRLPDLVEEARETAQRQSVTVELQYDSNKRSFTLSTEPAATTSQTKNEAPTIVREAAVPEGIEPQTFRGADQVQSSGDWVVKFFADGKSDGGGVELLDHGKAHALLIESNGTCQMLLGNLPQSDQTSWPAGEHEQRA